jgi:tetrahydromethanopterin S-methyltransferase subunit A
MNTPPRHVSAFQVIREQLTAAVAAPRCHRCGCFQQTVAALTSGNQEALAPLLDEARAVFQPQQYDCLGCPVCYPAIAANAFTEAFPEVGSGLDLCPTEAPEERQGWPPLPGDYHVLRYRAPVAVCTLNSAALTALLKDRAPDGMAIVGTLHTENLGIERLIKNSLANPSVRFLILCGEDTRQAIGHLPGQSLQSLFAHGVDARGRIREARGKRPMLKNVTPEEIQAFRDQVTLVPMIGETREEVIYGQVETSRRCDPGPYSGAPQGIRIPVVQAAAPGRLTLDPAGYFVLYPDTRKHCLVVEHYTNTGLLDCVIEGNSAGALYTTVIERHLLTRLDHAAYLGRELARAEHALLTGTVYIQDAAPGREPSPPSVQCGCGPACLPTFAKSG